jgi:hypothetical protein
MATMTFPRKFEAPFRKMEWDQFLPWWSSILPLEFPLGFFSFVVITPRSWVSFISFNHSHASHILHLIFISHFQASRILHSQVEQPIGQEIQGKSTGNPAHEILAL